MLSLVFGILGALIILEGIFIIIFPLASKNIMKKMSKNEKTVRKVGIIEFFLGLILLAISYIQKMIV